MLKPVPVVLIAGLALGGCSTSDPPSPVPTVAMPRDEPNPSEMGEALYEGKEYEGAAKWFRKAAEQGSAAAQFRLGSMYEFGLGVERDQTAALLWYRRSAEQGNADAQFAIYVLSNGEERLRSLLKAAFQGHPSAVEEISLLAVEGLADAQWWLATLYSEGTGIPQDHKAAARWLRQAAEQGHAPAQYDLGIMYYQGRGVAQDHREAVRWWKLAAEQGTAESADYALGLAYIKGLGVPQDFVRAHMRFNLAAAKGYTNRVTKQTAADSRDLLTKYMTPDQIAEAQQLAREEQERRQ